MDDLNLRIAYCRKSKEKVMKKVNHVLTQQDSQNMKEVNDLLRKRNVRSLSDEIIKERYDT